MTKNIELIPATIDDIPTIYDLAEKIWIEHYVPIIGRKQVDYMLGDMYSSTSLSEQMQVKRHSFYLIKQNSNDIGFISISGLQEMFIHKFYINTALQGIGFGAEVFRQVRVLYPQANSFSLTVNRQNYKAINFYFKLGFKIERVEDFNIGEGYWMNDFIMKWVA